MQCLIGVDVGSSDCKVMVMDTQGRILASAARPYPTRYPRFNWAENDPEDWFQAACHAIRASLQASQIDSQSVSAIAVDGPAHNVALMDESGAVIYPTLHWSDLRSIPQAERLEKTHAVRIFEITGSRVNPSWTLTQLLWLKENEPDVWGRLRRLLVTKDYVRYRLTGVYQTDVYDAIGTQLYNVSGENWSDELCRLLDFPREWLPPIAHAAQVSGGLTEAAAHDTGLCAGTPVVVSSGDSVIEALGIGAVQTGDCIVKIGTAANVNLVTTRPYPSQQTITYRHVVDPCWFSITPTNAGASTMRWFRDTFCAHEVETAGREGKNAYELIDQLALNAAAGCEGLLFHPYLMGERAPYWDPHLRGDFVGIRAGHRRQHFARAILEGVAFSIRDCLEVVQGLGEPIKRYFLIGGGAKSPLWRQILADVLGQTLVKPAVEDAAFGAAVIAGVGVGVFSSMAEATHICAQVETAIHPNPDHQALYGDYFATYRAIARDLTAHNHHLARLAETYAK